MAVTTTHPALRWAVPGAVVAIALGAAGAHRDFGRRDIDAARRAAPPSCWSTCRPPSLTSIVRHRRADRRPGPAGAARQLGGRGSSDFTSLVSGSHTLRVWYSGEDQQRLALLGTLGESDIVRNGTDVWTWSSETNAATHYQLPDRDGDADATVARCRSHWR